MCLWSSNVERPRKIGSHPGLCGGCWCLVGDFNVTRFLSKMFGGVECYEVDKKFQQSLKTLGE